MKRYWQKIVTRIDGLTLRERVIIFLMAALALIAMVNMLILAPQEAEQKRIAKRIQDEQNEITRIRAEIQRKVEERTADPNAQNNGRLRVLQAQADGLRETVAGMQRGLVSPDKMAALLEEMLRKNTRLRLAGLRKLPVVNLVDAPASPKTQDGADDTVTGLFRHGVELTVQGGYLDMVNYLGELERMPAQLFWGDLAFKVDEYPNATMTVTVYTLSLDKQWLHI